MNRNEFIKNMLLLFGATALPKAMQAMVQQYDRIYLLQSFVRGFQYYKGPNLLAKMKVGNLLQLVREPENEYDDFAIAIHFEGEKIGFVPAEMNEILAKIIDADLMQLQAEITHLEPKATAWENTAIAIYVLKESSNGLPKQASYLLNLEKPNYHSLKNKNHFYVYDDEIFENTIEKNVLYNQKNKDVFNFFKTKKSPETVFKHLRESFTTEQLKEIAEQNKFIINKNKLPKNRSVKEIACSLDNKITELDNYFSEKGYIITSLEKLENIPNKIINVHAIIDKSANQFLEIILA